MNTQDLIQSLTTDLKPVSPLQPARTRMLVIVISMLLAMSVRFLIIPNKPHWQEYMASEPFIYSSFVFIMGWLACAYSLTQLQLPTGQNSRGVLLGLGIFALTVIGFLIWGLTPAHIHSILPDSTFVTDSSCSLDITFSSFLPAAILIFTLRRGAPTNIFLVGLTIGVACTILGAYKLQFSCEAEMPFHILIWHLLVPSAVISTISVLLAKKFLSW